MNTYVSTSKVTTLSHEALDHTMELRASVAESMHTCAKLKEILRSFGYQITIKGEVDTTPLLIFAIR